MATPGSLADLIAPLDLGGFRDLLRRRVLHFHRGTERNRFAGLIDWAALREAIAGGAFPPEKLRVTNDGRTVDPRLYLRLGKADITSLEKVLESGASLIAEPLESYVPALAALCGDIAKHIPEKIYAGAIATTGAGGAFRLHYDPEDLIILQVEGRKRWKIYGPPVAAPVRGMAKPEPEVAEPYFDETLEPGDLLFVPAGNWHRCENGPGRSLHLGIFIEPPTGFHAVKALVPRLAEREAFRRPLLRFGGEDERAAHEAALKAELIRLIGETSLTDLAFEALKAKPPTKPRDE